MQQVTAENLLIHVIIIQLNCDRVINLINEIHKSAPATNIVLK